MSYGAAIDYLYGLQKHGIKFGLDNTVRLLELAGNPHRQFRCIHVAGTNGKGSVSAMSASILRAHGVRTGLFTSPHIASFTERISVDGMEVSEAEVTALTDELRSLAETDEYLNPTFFEFVTVIAFVYFARKGVEWAVIETGMGGRLDATNVIRPEVSVITSLSPDHEEFLGSSIAEIASEKAGIIKTDIPLVCAAQAEAACAVISQTALEKVSPISLYGRDFNSDIKSSGLYGSRFDYIDNAAGTASIEDIFVPLAGDYQAMNASLAIRATSIATEGAATRKFGSPEGKSITPRTELVKAGIAATRLRGRLEILNKAPLIIMDGAHNAGAAEVLAQFIRKYLDDRDIILVLGIMADKDVRGVLKALMPIVAEAIFTAPAYARAESPRRLAELAVSYGYTHISTAATVTDAVAIARDRQASCGNGKTPAVLITGSFYTLGEAVAAMGEKTTLCTLREML
jgi:dihydrofolate synthase / folylpolyglutamate synthase